MIPILEKRIIYSFVTFLLVSIPGIGYAANISYGTVFMTIEFNSNNSAKLISFSYSPINYNTFFPTMGSGDYRIKILDKEGKTIYSEKFSVSFLVQTEGKYTLFKINKTALNFRIKLPKNSYSIVFYHLQKEILSINLTKYLCNFNLKCERMKGENEYICPSDCGKPICGNKICEVEKNESWRNCCKDCPCPSGKICINNTCVDEKTFCGNKICESFENYKTCPKDCPSGSKDGYCDGIADGICDPDCKELKEFDPDCVRGNNLWIYLLLAAIAVFIGLIYFETKKKSKEESSEIYFQP